jgi:hypothetical protein
MDVTDTTNHADKITTSLTVRPHRLAARAAREILVFEDEAKLSTTTKAYAKAQARFEGFCEGLAICGLGNTPFAVQMDINDAWAKTVQEQGSRPANTYVGNTYNDWVKALVANVEAKLFHSDYPDLDI